MLTTGLLTEAQFAELARTGPAVPGMATLRAGLRGHRSLLLKALLIRVQRERDVVDPAVLRRFENAWELLERAERARPVTAREVLDYPTTGAWLAAALGAAAGAELEHRLERLESIAVTAALRAGCTFDLSAVAPQGTLSLTGVGRGSVGAERVRIRARARVVRIVPDDARTARGGLVLARPGRGRLTGLGPGWAALRPLPGTTALLDDLDPYRVPPGGVGAPPRAAADRTAIDSEAWHERWRVAHRLLNRIDPARSAEVRRAVRTVVPLSLDGPLTVPMSATLRAAPGAVLASLPASPRAMAETLVHEVHHSKLAALNELVPLHRRERSALHRVGWRSDPRPIAGVYQGVYAHLALTDLWRRAVAADGAPRAWRTRAEQRFERFHVQVGAALEILLESDELTIAGREFARHMQRHHASLGRVRGPLG
ncbi:HEXXH motif-containing putative peptide modification protein [Streptomyces sp. NPDC048623]|uniref:aKG-HExxH-type peptide beta-hydroxylase n=1 Tax=Streptomyces sp. NPDC048623 TaxID=3155761 RepID=UPI00341B6A57